VGDERSRSGDAASALAAAAIVATAAGAVAAAKGATDIVASRRLAKKATLRHEDALRELEAAREPVHEWVVYYGNQQIHAVTNVLGWFANWIERNQMAVNRLGHDPVGGIEVAVPELPAMKDEIRQVRFWIEGGIAGASAAAAAPQVALMGVSAFASASTGTAISTLSGAAATNATMAWLGGGSIAAGGGGIAAGQAVLTLITAAPAVFIGGVTIAIAGSKQKTSAKKYVADVKVACENVQTAVELLPRIAERVYELSNVLTHLVLRADHALRVLEGLAFAPNVHAPQFLDARQLTRAIREIINTPVLDETGELTTVSLNVVRKYR